MFGQVVTNSRFSGSLPPGNTVAGQFKQAAALGKQAAALAAASTKQEVNGALQFLNAKLPESPAVREAQTLIALVAGSEKKQRVARETIIEFLDIAERHRQKAA